MTREEAIRHIESIKPYVGTNIKDALNIAIKTLKQEPYNDTISRQAVLKAIEDDVKTGSYSCFASNNHAKCFKQTINELPPCMASFEEKIKEGNKNE